MNQFYSAKYLLTYLIVVSTLEEFFSQSFLIKYTSKEIYRKKTVFDYVFEGPCKFSALNTSIEQKMGSFFVASFMNFVK